MPPFNVISHLNLDPIDIKFVRLQVLSLHYSNKHVYRFPFLTTNAVQHPTVSQISELCGMLSVNLHVLRRLRVMLKISPDLDI